MTKTRASQTALSVAWLRATHQVLDSPLIFEDEAALDLLGPLSREHILSRAGELQTPLVRGLRSHVVLRSRFAEDRLRCAVERGVNQYILLGAGYDTFCVRQADWTHSLRITEVDQLATQADKRDRLESAGLAVPDNVVFLAVDFETETLADAFERGGIERSTRAFISCLGVMVYLNENAVDSIFSTVAQFASGSEIVFTFAQPRGANDPQVSALERLAAQAATAGEPFQSYFTVDEIRDKLTSFGFRQIDLLTPDEAATTYYDGRTDGLRPPRRISIASATL